MGDFGASKPEDVARLRGAIEQQSSQGVGARDPAALQASAAERHAAAQLARAEGRCPSCGGSPEQVMEITGCSDKIHVVNQQRGDLHTGDFEVETDADRQFKDPADLMPDAKGMRIVKECTATGEPFFVFRAKDIFTPMILARYAELLDAYLPDDSEMHEGVHTRLDQVKHWQKGHPNEIRYPD